MTWVNQATDFAYGSSPTSEQLQNLRDNLTAFANGDSGAPTVQAAGLASSAITTSKIADANVDRSKLKTSGGSVSGTLSVANVYDLISLQDYCFAVNMGGSTPPTLWTYPSVSASYVARFCLSCYWDEDYWGTNYSVYYRYVTSSDKPFIYAIQDKDGKIIHCWESDDPPPGYWGLDKAPEGWEPPIIVLDAEKQIITPAAEICQFNVDKEFITTIRDKAQVDKTLFASVLDGYELKDSIFVSKNISEI